MMEVMEVNGVGVEDSFPSMAQLLSLSIAAAIVLIAAAAPLTSGWTPVALSSSLATAACGLLLQSHCTHHCRADPIQPTEGIKKGILAGGWIPFAVVLIV